MVDAQEYCPTVGQVFFYIIYFHFIVFFSFFLYIEFRNFDPGMDVESTPNYTGYHHTTYYYDH